MTIRVPGWLPVIAIAAFVACGGETESADNPCAADAPNVEPSLVQQGDRELNTGGLSMEELVARGDELWNDKTLSSSGGLACASCHVNTYGAMLPSFAEPYPHRVMMMERETGITSNNAAEMVQICMIVPMQNEPLDWTSVELAALTEYVLEIQKGFDPESLAPSGMGANPCNPCGGNPCNPCGS